MSSRRVLMCCLAVFATLASSVSAQQPDAAAAKPHILILLADDLGYTDVSFNGGTIKTPNIDRIASSGAKLSSFYVQPVCSPTRAALLTGRYPMRYGLQVGVVRPYATYGLPLEERTMAQALHAAGYLTSIIGKWHLGLHERAFLPTQRGFDRQYGHYVGALDYFTHKRDGGFDWHRDDKVNRDEGYTTNLIGDEAVRQIESHDTKKPLFMYVPFNAPHTPLQALPEDLKVYEHVKNKKRRAYSAMVHCVDRQVGRILEALAKKGMLKNTIIIFSSDNGGPLGLGATNGILRGGKGSLYQGGVCVAACVRWDGRIKSGITIDEPMHIVDLYPTLLKLAGASLEQRMPIDGKDILPVLTQGKRSPHEDILFNITPTEGALRLGNWKLVVHGLKGDANGKDAKGKEAKGKKGKNAKGKKGTKAGKLRIELFDLAKDPSEANNLAEQHPEQVRMLRARLDAYARAAYPSRQAPPAKNFKVPKIWGESD